MEGTPKKLELARTGHVGRRNAKSQGIPEMLPPREKHISRKTQRRRREIGEGRWSK